MARAYRHKLYVNLSASQTRRRLKGHGFGVQRVESHDRNRAVIVHTATGQHLRELQALFADVGHGTQADRSAEPVENMRNLGPASAGWLRDVGIATAADLRRVGPVFAFRLVRDRRPGTSLNLLWALAAALQDRDWRDISTAEKQMLLQQVDP